MAGGAWQRVATVRECTVARSRAPKWPTWPFSMQMAGMAIFKGPGLVPLCLGASLDALEWIGIGGVLHIEMGERRAVGMGEQREKEVGFTPK